MSGNSTTPSNDPRTTPFQRPSLRRSWLRTLVYFRSLGRHIPPLLDRLQPSETAMLFATAILVGGGTGLGAVFFIKLIALIQSVFFDGGASLLGSFAQAIFFLAPIAGGLLAGPIISFFAREAKGHGVPEVMQAIALRGGRIRPRVVLAKIAASALCIGSGGSAGREGPIVQVGAGLGSTLGQWFHLSENRIRNLVACGAASGIAATFNAPISGVLFAMEIILGELHIGDMGNVIISAVTASTVARIFLGERPAFSIPDYGMGSPWELGLYAVLGVLAALCGVFFIRLLYRFEDLFDGWRFPDALKPAVGGFLLGILALVYLVVLRMAGPEVQNSGLGIPSAANLPVFFGSGFPLIETALSGSLPVLLLLALVLLKPLATSFTLGSGNSGGVFAPSLFTGAVLGGAFGSLLEHFAPGSTAGAGAFAVVGMAAVFAGAARAPFTAILIVFEMTGDYRLMLPLMAGVIVSFLVAERIHPESIYTLKLVRRGIHLQRGRDVDVMQSVRVEEVMVRKPLTVPENLSLALLSREFLTTGRHGFSVLDSGGKLAGVISLEDYRRISEMPGADLSALAVRDVMTRDILSVYPDETVGSALRKMAPRDLSRIPVVDRSDPHRLVGVIRRNDIVRAYEFGVVRREQVRNRAEISHALEDTRAMFIDIQLRPDSGSVGRKVVDLQLPRDAVLVSIRRGVDLVIPHGDTELKAGDVVTALCEPGCVGNVRDKFL